MNRHSRGLKSYQLILLLIFIFELFLLYNKQEIYGIFMKLFEHFCHTCLSKVLLRLDNCLTKIFTIFRCTQYHNKTCCGFVHVLHLKLFLKLPTLQLRSIQVLFWFLKELQWTIISIILFNLKMYKLTIVQGHFSLLDCAFKSCRLWNDICFHNPQTVDILLVSKSRKQMLFVEPKVNQLELHIV